MLVWVSVAIMDSKFFKIVACAFKFPILFLSYSRFFGLFLCLGSVKRWENVIQVPGHLQMVAYISSLPSLQSGPSTREHRRPKSFLATSNS